jgi:hypothetical protein
MHPAEAKARNDVLAKASVSSTSSDPKRTSGLSDPYRSMASSHVISGTAPGREPCTASWASSTASDTNPRTSSWLTKLASRSSCMNSNWRSARRSSSRRQRAIW